MCLILCQEGKRKTLDRGLIVGAQMARGQWLRSQRLCVTCVGLVDGQVDNFISDFGANTVGWIYLTSFFK